MMNDPLTNQAPVTSRRVHYFSGFDPRGAAYYHRLFKEESSLPQPQGGFIQTGRRRRANKQWSQWQVNWSPTATASSSVQTEHVFMSWDDLIRDYWPRGPWSLTKAFVTTYIGIVRDVDLRRVRQIYSTAFVTGVAPAAFLISTLLVALLCLWWLPTGVGLLCGALWLWATWHYAERKGLFWLLRIFYFVIQMGRGQTPGLSARTQEWVEWVIKRQTDDPVDEVLLVGHSVGTLVMVDVVDALLKDERWQALQAGRPTLMLTLGQCYPFVAMVPKAHAFREALQRLCNHPQLLWCDVTARIDPLCFYNAHPLTKTGVPHEEAPMPVKLAASFMKMYTPAKWKNLRKDKLQTHFLYLQTPECVGNFHVFDVLYGPKPFAHLIGQKGL